MKPNDGKYAHVHPTMGKISDGTECKCKRRQLISKRHFLLPPSTGFLLLGSRVVKLKGAPLIKCLYVTWSCTLLQKEGNFSIHLMSSKNSLSLVFPQFGVMQNDNDGNVGRTDGSSSYKMTYVM